MKTVREYLRHAEECDALAQKAMSPEQRQMIADMSSTWRMLAEQRRSRLLKAAREARGHDVLPPAPVIAPVIAEDGDAKTSGPRPDC